MRTRSAFAALLLGAAQIAVAQAPSRISLQAGVGVAFRNESPYIAGSSNGLQATARLGRPVRPYLRLVTEVTLVRYADESAIFPTLCPQPGPCLAAIRSVPGLGLAGFAAGIQPQVGHGPLQLILTATGGAYWLYHRQSPLPGSALGLRGSFGLGMRVDPRVRAVLEAGVLTFPGSRARDANSRHVGLGLIVS